MKIIAFSSVLSAALCAARLLGGCPSNPYAKGPDPLPVFSDAGGAEVETNGECRVMCENLAKLGCPESALPVEAIDGGWSVGRSCESTCTVAEAHRRDVRALCVANASTPAQVRLCCPKGTPGCTPTLCEGL